MKTFVVGRIFFWILERAHLALRLALGKGRDSPIEQETNYIVKIQKAIRLDRPIVFDIGGHRGEWAKSLARKASFQKIYVFEPLKESVEILSQNLGDLISAGKAEVFQFAISDNDSQAPLHHEPLSPGMGSLASRDLRHFGLNLSKTEMVEVRKLSTLVRDLALPSPDIIKMDIEGFELKAMVGAEAILEKVSILQFEFGGSQLDLRQSWRDYWYFLQSQNFIVFRLTPFGLTMVPFYRELDESYSLSNFYAVRKSLLPN